MASVTFDTEPDWSGLRAASVAVGVREAARQASSHLPSEEQNRFVERVMKRCSREGWVVQAREAMVQARPRGELSANVRTGAQVVQDTLLEDGKATKLAAMKYARRTVEAASDEAIAAPLDALERAGLVKSALQSASIAGDWTAQTSDHGPQLNFFAISMEHHDQDSVERPVIDAEQA